MRHFLVVLILGATPVAPLAAQNLITNPDFDVDDLNWFHDTSDNQHLGTADADACPDSGSLTANGVNTSPNFYYFLIRPLDCIPVTAGETLHASLRYRFSGSSFVRLYYSQCVDASCTNCTTFSGFVDTEMASAAWAPLEGTWSVPSSGVAAVWLTLDAFSAAPFTIDLDRVYVGRIARISSDGFEGGTTCRWSSTVP